MIENVSESQEKVQLEAECNETDKIEIPLIPALDLDTSGEFAKTLNRSDAENLAQKFEEDSNEHDGNEGINESFVMNGTTERDESFIPETQLETSIEFELEGSSADNKETEPKTLTESVSEIENAKSLTSDAMESKDLISVSEKQDGSCERHEMVDNGLVSKTEAESITEASIQTELVLANNAGDTNQEDDKENAPNQPTEADNGTTIDNGKYKKYSKCIKCHFVKIPLFLRSTDLNVNEEENKSGSQEQPEKISPSHILNEGESEAQPKVEIEIECNETAEVESSFVPSGEFAEALKISDADNLAQEVVEPSFTLDTNQSVIESPATNDTSKEDDLFVPETQFDKTNDFEMESNNFTPFINVDSECNDSVTEIQNGSGENHEMNLVDESITETSDQLENEEMDGEDVDVVIVYEKQVDTFEDDVQKMVPIKFTEVDNFTAVEKGNFN